MAEQVRIDLTAKDDASKTIDKVADKVDDLEAAKVEVPLTAEDDATKTIDKVAAETKELSGADVRIILKAQADQARAELKEVQGLLNDLDAKVAQPKVDVDTAGAEDGLRRVHDEADGSRSVLANMVGNSAQDLGALGGAAGSAGTALGQLAEYAADGNINLRGLATMGGPLLGVAAASALIANGFKENAQRIKEAKAQVDKFVDAMRDGKTLLGQFNDELETTSKLEFRQLFGGMTDISGALDKANVSVDTFAEAIGGGEQRVLDLRDALKEAGVEQGLVTEIVNSALIAARDYTDAQLQAEVAARLLGTTTADTTEKMRAHKEKMDDATGATDDHVWADKKLVEQQKLVRESIDKTNAKFDELRGRLDFKQAVQTFQFDFLTAIGEMQSGVGQTDQDLLDLQGTYLNVAEKLKLNPLRVESDLEAIEQGDVERVFTNAQKAIVAAGKVKIPTEFEEPKKLPKASGGGSTPAPGGTAAPVPVVNVTQVLPRGWRGDALADAANQARRAGGYYRRGRHR